MPKHQPPSHKSYQASHPSIGVHLDLPTFARIKKLRDASGLSYGHLVRQALGVVEKEVGRTMESAFTKGRHAGVVEGKKAGLVAGRSAGYQEGRAEGFAEGRRVGSAETERLYKLEVSCATCGDALAVESGSSAAAYAIAAIQATKCAHCQRQPDTAWRTAVDRSGKTFKYLPL